MIQQYIRSLFYLFDADAPSHIFFFVFFFLTVVLPLSFSSPNSAGQLMSISALNQSVNVLYSKIALRSRFPSRGRVSCGPHPRGDIWRAGPSAKLQAPWTAQIWASLSKLVIAALQASSVLRGSPSCSTVHCQNMRVTCVSRCNKGSAVLCYP